MTDPIAPDPMAVEVVTERHQGLELLQLQRDTLEMLLLGTPLPETLDHMAQAIERQSPYKMWAAIHLLDSDATHFDLAIAPSLPASYLQATEGMAIDSRTRPGCVAAATRQRVTIDDVDADPQWQAFSEFARPLGIRAAWFTPIVSFLGAVVGTFAVYCDQPRHPAEQDLAVVDMFTRTVALAIERARAQDDQALLASIVASSRDAIVSKDLDGRITSWNRGAQDLFGYTAEEAIGQSVTMLIPADHLAEEPRIIAMIRRGETVDHYETVRRRKNGSLVEISLTVSPIRDASGSICGASKIARDISDRRAVARALAESESFSRGIFESSPDCVQILDGDGRLLGMNANGLRAMEIDDFSSLQGSLWSEWWPAQARQDLATSVETARAEGVARSQSYCPTAKGTPKWWDVSLAPIRDGDGNVLRFVSILRDITESRAAEAALREADARLRFMAESMPQKVFTARPNGDVDYFNPQWSTFTGLSFEEIRDWGWTQFIHPRDLEESVRIWRHCLESGEPFDFEHRIRRVDGEYRWHISRALPFREESGRVLMWIGSSTDVHDIKRTEQALRESEHQTKEQAFALADLHRRKDEFLAMLSHELRNPLAPIANAVQLLHLQRSNESPLQQQARSVIERQVGQLKRLVDDLLEVSRITTGRVQLQLEPVLVSRIVERAVETVRPLVEQRRHELKIVQPAHDLWLLADPSRMEQVLVNLLTNAAKYTDEGGRLWLTAEQEGDSAVLRVRDTGIGIAPELLPRIFDLFTQADRSLARSQGGLGIGLTLVRRLVELHRGTVEAQSAVGEGSEFVVRIPMLAAQARLESSPVADALALNGKFCRVLVVEDNVDSATSLATLLRELGHDVRVAHDGSAALRAALDYRPDAVLLDIGLPGLDGYQVARQLRQLATAERVLLVAMTGYGKDSDRQRAHEAGFDHHLTKPYDFTLLQKILASVRGQTA